MTAKQYLSQARTLDREIESLTERCLRARAAAERITSVLTGMPRGGLHDWTDAVDKAIEYANRLADLMGQAVDTKLSIVQTIAGVDNADQRQVLSMRYLDGKSWQHIATKLHADRTTVWRWHVAALKKIEPQTCNITQQKM